MDLAEFTSDYVRMFRENGVRVPPRKELAKEIALAAAERDGATFDMPTDEFEKYAERLVPQVEYYLS